MVLSLSAVSVNLMGLKPILDWFAEKTTNTINPSGNFDLLGLVSYQPTADIKPALEIIPALFIFFGRRPTNIGGDNWDMVLGWVAVGGPPQTQTLLLPTFFANASFLFLFLAMAFYWIDLAFFEGQKAIQKPITIQSMGNFDLTLKLVRENVGKFSLLLANLSLIFLLCIRWKDSGHFPLSNLYESLMFLSWSCTSIHLFLIAYGGKGGAPASTISYPPTADNADNAVLGGAEFSAVEPLTVDLGGLVGAPSAPSAPTNNNPPPIPGDPTGGGVAYGGYKAGIKMVFFEQLLGAVLAPLALFLNAFATFSLPTEMQAAGPLVPALQSNWLMMHVTVMIISYAALILGSLLSIVFVIAIKINNRPHKAIPGDPTSSGVAVGGYKAGVFLGGAPKASPEASNVGLHAEHYGERAMAIGFVPVDHKIEHAPNINKTQKIYSNLDYLSYRIIGIGFPFLTIGILSGAVWANEAWGSYWSWDPKETWALLTWLIFAIYLHTRLTKGWEGEKPALIASFGFIVVWICYLGVNLLGEGLHSYGFFST